MPMAPSDRPIPDLEVSDVEAHEAHTQARGSARASGATCEFLLQVTSGREIGKVLRVPNGTERLFIGKSALSDLRLEDVRVSRRHAALEASGCRLHLTDLGSTNGTFVGGLQVGNAFLTGGESLRVGDTSISVSAVGVTSPLETSTLSRFGRAIGISAAMRRVYPRLAKLAASNVAMIVEGETGTGKEVVAESIHEASARADAPFVVFDCTTVPPNLVESALFGHERGSFTGAVTSRQGVFEQAHRGTLFLDEIGDLELGLQAKLLRALERREVQRVGGSTWIKVDVRIIAATRRDLEKMIQARTFRDDLFYRLAVARVELPPLRQRAGDVDVLARHFWTELGGAPENFPDHASAVFHAYDWPGNVRELYNTVSHMMALGEFAILPASRASVSVAVSKPTATPSSAPDVIQSVIDAKSPFPQARERVMREFERRFLEAVLERYGGNISRAARESGIQRRFFYVLKGRQG
jgi:two-component system, NtrC family, response regulator HydG